MSRKNSFQSTPARSGRHALGRRSHQVGRVSIHARAQRATVGSPRPGALGGVSIHARAQRATGHVKNVAGSRVFQSTPARSGRRLLQKGFESMVKFQSTPARSGRQLGLEMGGVPC